MLRRINPTTGNGNDPERALTAFREELLERVWEETPFPPRKVA